MALTDGSLMPFGKYKGVTMANIPAEYLDWLYGEMMESKHNSYDAKQVIVYINQNRDAIDKELNNPNKIKPEQW